MNTKSKIEWLLKDNFDVFEISIIDDSHNHKNHKKDTSGGHFKLLIISDNFCNIKLIDRHRLIYKILDQMIKKEIHALSIKALSIKEYTK